jgi:hypothetical protein
MKIMEAERFFVDFQSWVQISLPYVDHAKPPLDASSRKKKLKFVWSTTRIASQTINDTARGVRQ